MGTNPIKDTRSALRQNLPTSQNRSQEVRVLDESLACDFESWEDPIVAPALALFPNPLPTPALPDCKEGPGEIAQLVPQYENPTI